MVSQVSHSARGFVRRFLSTSLLAFSIKLASAGLSFGMFVFLAQAMTAAEYGRFAALFSLATLLAALGGLGQRSVALRFGSAYHEAQSHDLRRGVVQRGYRLVSLGTVIAAALGGAIYLVINAQFGMWPLVAIVVLTLALALAEYQSFALRITAGVALSLVTRDVLWRLSVCLMAGAAVVWALPWSDWNASTWAFVLGALLLGFTVGQFLLAERIAPALRIRGSTAQDRTVWNQPMVGLWMSTVVMIVAPSVSVILIEIQIGADEAGPYFAALRTSQLLNLFLFATSVICAPMLSRAMQRQDWAEVQKVCTLTALVGGGFGLFGFCVLLVLGSPLLNLFGPDFADAHSILVILAAGFLFNTLAGPTGPLLEMSGKEGFYLKVLVAVNTVGLVSLPVTIHWLGPLGAAINTALIAASWNIAAVVYCRRSLGVDPSLWGLIRRPLNPDKMRMRAETEENSET